MNDIFQFWYFAALRSLVWMLAAGALICFNAQAQTGEEVPFITSPGKVTLQMLTAVGAKRGDSGSPGDPGIDPLLAALSPANAQAAGVADKAVGFEKSGKVQVWAAPAQVDGLWCAVGLLQGASIRLVQKHQTFTGVLAWRERTRPLTGTINGSELRVPAGNSGELVLQAVGNTMRITGAQGGMALAQGQTFVRVAGSACNA